MATRIVLTAALALWSWVSLTSAVLAQASQTVTPVPITPPTLNTTTLTCQVNCDTQAMNCQNSCVAPAISNLVASPTGVTSPCTLSCSSQQLVCKQRC